MRIIDQEQFFHYVTCTMQNNVAINGPLDILKWLQEIRACQQTPLRFHFLACIAKLHLLFAICRSARQTHPHARSIARNDTLAASALNWCFLPERERERVSNPDAFLMYTRHYFSHYWSALPLHHTWVKFKWVYTEQGLGRCVLGKGRHREAFLHDAVKLFPVVALDMKLIWNSIRGYKNKSGKDFFQILALLMPLWSFFVCEIIWYVRATREFNIHQICELKAAHNFINGTGAAFMLKEWNPSTMRAKEKRKTDGA